MLVAQSSTVDSQAEEPAAEDKDKEEVVLVRQQKEQTGATVRTPSPTSNNHIMHTAFTQLYTCTYVKESITICVNKHLNHLRQKLHDTKVFALHNEFT